MPWSIVARRPGGEDRHEHDERDADHQRRGGDRGALRLAARVLAREPAGEALEALERPADQRRSAGARASARAARSRRSSARAPRPSADAVALAVAGVAEQAVEQQRRRRRASTTRGDDDAPPAQVAAGRACTPSRIASTGSTRVARRAGTKPETTVATIADGEAGDDRARLELQCSVVPRSSPKARQQRAQAGREQQPAGDADDRRRARRSRGSRRARSAGPAAREAPSVRSSANSRVRWATVTEKVLKIRKPPTSSATPANTSSAVRMKPSASERSCACFSACSLPVRTANSGAELGGDRRLELLRRGAARGRDRDVVVAVVAGHALRLGQRHRHQPRAGEVLRVAERGDAGRPCSPSSGARPATVTLSPTLKSYLSAVALSITTSSSVSGLPPST